MGSNIGANLSQYSYSDLNQGSNATSNNTAPTSNTTSTTPTNPFLQVQAPGQQFNRAYTENFRPGYKEFGPSGQYYQPIYNPQYSNFSRAPGFYSPGYGAFGGGGGYSAGFGGFGYNPFISLPRPQLPVTSTPGTGGNAPPPPPTISQPGNPGGNISVPTPVTNPAPTPSPTAPGGGMRPVVTDPMPINASMPSFESGVGFGPDVNNFSMPAPAVYRPQTQQGITAGGFGDMRVQDLLRMLSQVQSQ